MAMMPYTSTAPIGADLVYRAVTAIEHVILEMRVWSRARATAKTLSKLTAWELDDLGLSRADIKRASYKAARKAI